MSLTRKTKTKINKNRKSDEGNFTETERYKLLKPADRVDPEVALARLHLMELAVKKALKRYRNKQGTYSFIHRVIQLLPLVLSAAVTVLLAIDPSGIMKKIALGLSVVSTISNTLFALFNFKVFSKELKMIRERFLLLQAEVDDLKNRVKNREEFSLRAIDDLKERYFKVYADSLDRTLKIQTKKCKKSL